MRIFLWLVSILGALAGGLQLFDTMMRATTAPQQAAGGAMAAALAVVPYVVARGCSEVTDLLRVAFRLPCVRCREKVHREAKVCPYCGTSGPTESEGEAQKV